MLYELLAWSVGLNLAVFTVAYLLRTDKLTDFTYSFTFIVLALLSLVSGTGGAVSILLVAMVSLWALRLGLYLGFRISKAGRDKRFDDIRVSFWKFAGFWMLQGVSVWVIMLPSLMLISGPRHEFAPVMILGVAVWLAGLLIESVADYQKYRFINRPKNKGRWIDEGLWSYSRHPNYLGEILVWVGVYIYAFTAVDHPLIAAIGPLWITVLLLFVSGIPMLEKRADEKWGSDEGYRKYKQRTPLLVPFIGLKQK